MKEGDRVKVIAGAGHVRAVTCASALVMIRISCWSVIRYRAPGGTAGIAAWAV